MSQICLLLMLGVLSGPRPFGYFIGDEITLDTEVAWAAGFALESASVPRPGPVTYWLDLKSVKTQEVAAGRYRLRLRYQVFYAPLGVQVLDVPGFTLVATRSGQRVERPVRSWRFSMSALRDVGPRSSDDTVTIRDDVTPKLISSQRYAVLGSAWAVLALASALALAFHRAWGPFRRRAGRPFAQAASALRRLPESTEDYVAGLLSLHRAFDAAAGRRVLADDLSDVLRALPRFAAATDEIQTFFQASQRAFFGEDPQGAMMNLPPAQLAVLGARLAKAERESA